MVYLANKKKIINDPVYGFISIPGEFFYDLVSHPWFQRLRNIKQLGLTSFVYPGANHSRFQHALGSFHLMKMAVSVLRSKGVEISCEEEEAACAAILLHDIGHGPFSHALETSLIDNITHEDISLLLMSQLNKIFDGKLDLSLEIFKGTYPRKFFHELITGQLDMDRLDYLTRDSFFTGVIEGSVGSERIIRMLNVSDDRLVIEEKGIYSIEKFLIARRFMFWQVYMHKTVLASESLLVKTLTRARKIASSGADLYSTPALKFFLYNDIGHDDLTKEGKFTPTIVASSFCRLDDSDIMVSIKYWADSDDEVLSDLSDRLIKRNLFAVEIESKPFSEKRISELKEKAGRRLGLVAGAADYYVFTDNISNTAYASDASGINILLKKGETAGISSVSDMFDNRFLSEKITKYFICYPKECKGE